MLSSDPVTKQTARLNWKDFRLRATLYVTYRERDHDGVARERLCPFATSELGTEGSVRVSLSLSSRRVHYRTTFLTGRRLAEAQTQGKEGVGPEGRAGLIAPVCVRSLSPLGLGG